MASAPYDLSTDVKPPHVNTHLKDSKTHDYDPTSPHYAPAMIAAHEGDASLALPNAPHNSEAATKEKRKSWTQRLFHHDHKDGGNKDDPIDGESAGKERKKSIADSGPYIFAFGEFARTSRVPVPSPELIFGHSQIRSRARRFCRRTRIGQMRTRTKSRR